MKPRPDTKLLDGSGVSLDVEEDGVLVKENMETSREGIFACGTVIDGYNSVESVMKQGKIAGKSASEYILNL